MAQRPKFKVHKYGMGRKTSLIAILQKLKPCLFDQYASFLAQLPADDSCQLLNGVAASTAKLAKSTANIDLKCVSAKSIWQSRLKQGNQQRLPTIQQLDTLPKQLNANAKQLQRMRTVGTSKACALSYPIKRFVINKVREFHLFRGLNGAVKHPIIYEQMKIWPQFGIILAAPLVAQRIEIDLRCDPVARTLLPLWHCRDGSFFSSDPNAIIVLGLLKRAISLRLVVDDLADSSQPVKSVESMPNTLNSFMAKFQTPWARDPNKFMKIVLTYFFVFCVIGFLFTVFP